MTFRQEEPPTFREVIAMIVAAWLVLSTIFFFIGVAEEHPEDCARYTKALWAMPTFFLGCKVGEKMGMP